MSEEILEQLNTGDIIRPFQLETSSLRGRIVRFDTVLNDILSAHDYPDIVSQLLAETITLCALLSSMLKYEGVFTLQTSGDGPIKMLVSDVTSDGDIRACATFDEDRLEEATKQLAAFSSDLDESSDNQLAQLLGKGYIAFTVDQGKNTDRYQGIVELKGRSLIDCVQHYFSQSEQIDTGIKLAVGQREGRWRSGGIMLQQMPDEGGEKGEKLPSSNYSEDDWRRSMILMQSCTEEELLSLDLHGHDILMRLFHEEGVRIFEPIHLQHQCRCSDDKVKNILMMLDDEEKSEMIEDGNLSMTCEFCSKQYFFDPESIKVNKDASSQHNK
ncbi:MAG: Hsp33 family molecular chaperone HslO [Pseudomonadota bacterium]